MANYCENTCNLSNTQEQVKLDSRRYRCTCFDGFHGPCCNDKVPPPEPKYGPGNCRQDYITIRGQCVAPGEGIRPVNSDIEYVNTCLKPGECPPNTTLMGRCDGTTEKDTSYCAPNQIWCDNDSCWGPTNDAKDSWYYSDAKDSLITCDNATISQNLAYPPNRGGKLNKPKESHCRVLGWCGPSDRDMVARGKYKDPTSDKFNKVNNTFWADTYQRRCVLKPE